MSIYRSDDGRRAIRAWCEDRLAGWGQPHDTTTVPTAAGATHVVRSGEGPPLVLVPGTNFAAATWLDLVAALAGSFAVHALDLPGQPGLSHDARPAGGAKGGHGAWLAEVVAGLGLDQPVVVAHSLGAVAALQAASSGAPVRRLVLLDPAGVIRLTVSGAVLRPTLPWLRASNERTAAGLLAMMMGPGATPDPALVAWMALVGSHVRTSLAPSPIPRQWLARVAMPVDVLSGAHDAFLPPARLQRGLARRLPHATVEVVEGAGHLLPHERPDVVVDRLRQVAEV